jgi:hypothetical protein
VFIWIGEAAGDLTASIQFHQGHRISALGAESLCGANEPKHFGHRSRGPLSSAPQSAHRSTETVLDIVSAISDIAPFEDRYGHRHAGTADVLCHADAGVFDLVGVLAAQLRDDLEQLPNAGRTHWMAFAEKSA